jgi:hypothetical protein
LNNVSRSRSLVGRVSLPLGAISDCERNFPAITRIDFGGSAVCFKSRYGVHRAGWILFSDALGSVDILFKIENVILSGTK